MWMVTLLAVWLPSATLVGCGEKAPRVQTQKVVRKDLVERIRASGRIRAARSVEVSATTIGRVETLHVREGDRVAPGDTLVDIDPIAARGRLDAALANVEAATATLALSESQLRMAEDELQRQEGLFERHLTPESEFISARTSHAVQVQTVQQNHARLAAARAEVQIARHDLGQVTLQSRIHGVVVRLNVEEGENVVTGTMNNPGTSLMTVADLTRMEVEVLVDETEVVNLELGQTATVEVDAFPDSTLTATVTEIGNSSARPARLGSQESIDFKVVLVIDTPFDRLRPDLSATTEITVAERAGAVAVPIRALTLRDPDRETEKEKGADEGDDEDRTDADRTGEVDGVFVVDQRRVRFQPVETGIAGERDFEVLGGLSEGDEVVIGPFQTLQKLETGEKIRIRQRGSRGKDSDD